MAKPRIFVSSTYYDLKHLRSSLENFIDGLGYEPVLSEKGDIAYTPEAALEESCYREVRNAEIFVLIVGGRYGSEANGSKNKTNNSFFERYDSITKTEFKNAVTEDIPIYILIEANVYSEFQTFLKNREAKDIAYAHVDSVNIFHLVEEILALPKNNPIKTFERYSEIEEWLKEQWAGLFRELLNKTTGQKQLTALSAQVTELSEVNKTLRTYLEAVVQKIRPDESAKLIKAEQERLDQAQITAKLANNVFCFHIEKVYRVPREKIIEAIRESTDLESFLSNLGKHVTSPHGIRAISRLLNDDRLAALGALNGARAILNLPPFERKRIKIPPLP